MSQVKLVGNRGLAKEVKADLSRTHFTLGNHKFDWQTDAMRTQVSVIASCSVLVILFSIISLMRGWLRSSFGAQYLPSRVYISLLVPTGAQIAQTGCINMPTDSVS